MTKRLKASPSTKATAYNTVRAQQGDDSNNAYARMAAMIGLTVANKNNGPAFKPA